MSKALVVGLFLIIYCYIEQLRFAGFSQNALGFKINQLSGKVYIMYITKMQISLRYKQHLELYKEISLAYGAIMHIVSTESSNRIDTFPS